MDKIKQLQSHADIAEQARVWVLRFNGDQSPTDADIRALRAWTGRSPAHRAALSEAEEFWCEAELLRELAVPLERKAEGASGPWFAAFAWPRQGLAVAAGLLLGFSLIFSSLWFTSDSGVGNGIYTTAVGEQSNLVLEDGSLVWLDTNSQLRVDYQAGVRHLYLLQGKAYFDVAKNPQRPFEVYAQSGLVRAVGTAFSVYLADNEVEVLVGEGRVELGRVAQGDDAREPVDVFHSLGRGQGARFDRVDQVYSELDDKSLAQELAWKKGVLVFVRDPLEQVVAEVSRYTDIQIDIDDPALGRLVMGGRFRVGELEALFEVLDIGFGVKARYLNEHHVQLYFASNE